MKRLITLTNFIVITTIPLFTIANGYQWINNTKSIQGEVIENKQASYDMGSEMIK